ncbi:MAG TPA: sulfatase-like hydrolase/transferase [Candidatus Hydrogenedentes bacterium]|nr:sulfatase-like hydrolase/transferase [Candidatus Hydrogenedentota bacterium]HQH53881.1 sulfatase-like hydrolase/transferase [Candidatus Hydrogenedentota bacterium]
MNRREFLLRSLGAGSAAVGCAAYSRRTKAASETPNIVLILADDLGYECLGCYGSASYQTPVLDSLARTGIRFERCHAQPLCTPSRVKLMTGKHNFRNYRAFGVLDPGEYTFAHLLKQRGYATCVAGKWQLYGRQQGWEGKGSMPEQAGFDEYCLWQVKELGERYANPTVLRNGMLETLEGAYGPDVYSDAIIDFIKRHRGKPFFAYYPMCLVHNPFEPTPDSPEWDTARGQQDDKYFDDMVAYMDKTVGRIVDALAELGLRENTLLLFTGDNGTNQRISSKMRDGSLISGAKGLTLDTGTHVPLIANWPGVIPEGRVCGDLIDFADFLPTFAEVAGGALPREQVVDGRSFLPQLLGQKGNPHEALLCYYDPRWGNRERACFARDKEWKLYDNGRLFNVKDDPLEQHPISGEIQGAAAARAKLEKVLEIVP